ncbi:hypothetical protein SynBIOSE41_03685 [Synechococcus sp. BIOS-E4-1]|nr:hypothetical protein SynBIOSE41_03685 [Synechococcus sp. BIOS-E4-1]
MSVALSSDRAVENRWLCNVLLQVYFAICSFDLIVVSSLFLINQVFMHLLTSRSILMGMYG